jgi:hypothetical protein
MSTSPEPIAGDEVVSALSHWLAFHLGNRELNARLRAIGTDGLEPDAAEAVEELLGALEDAPEGRRGGLEMHVREALEAVALG